MTKNINVEKAITWADQKMDEYFDNPESIERHELEIASAICAINVSSTKRNNKIKIEERIQAYLSKTSNCISKKIENGLISYQKFTYYTKVNDTIAMFAA